jgi:hypothetical protein
MAVILTMPADAASDSQADPSLPASLQNLSRFLFHTGIPVV